MITVAVLGIGVRGKLYCDLLMQYAKQVKIVAVCDQREKTLNLAKLFYGIEEKNCFNSDNEFFATGKLADAVIICTQDAQHFSHAMKALELGYDILIEKPISNKLEECIQLEKAALEAKKIVAVCHELRYTSFAMKIKEILDSGEIGSVVTINQTEKVGYYHYAHSYVRGNWRKSEKSSPIILAKCCHDLDIIAYFAGSRCMQVSSFGSLSFFKNENQPTKAKDYCFECRVRKKCPYNAVDFYQKNRNWAERAGFSPPRFTKKAVTEWSSDKNNPYARCVFCCDNDVADHQVVNMLFEGGIYANLTMTAFSASESRSIFIGCTNGEISGDFEKNIITVMPFGTDGIEYDMNTVIKKSDTHCGGDRGLIVDFLIRLSQNNCFKDLTDISQSVHSHKIAFMAEKSSQNNGEIIEIK